VSDLLSILDKLTKVLYSINQLKTKRGEGNPSPFFLIIKKMERNNPYRNVLENNIGLKQFPGGDTLGLNLQQIRNLIKTQNRAKGFRFTLPLGASNFNIDISGTAKVFLGFIFGGSTFTPIISDTFSLTINNEIIIQSGNTQAFSSSRDIKSDYYWFPRPLSGTDEVTLSFQAPVGGVELFDLWYI